MKQVVTVILVFISFLSCNKSDNSVKIEYWCFGGQTSYMNWVKNKVDEFNVTHPGIKVNLSYKSWHMIRELLYTNFTSGTGPDVMRVHANFAPEFGEAGYYYPINKFADFDSVRKWYMPVFMEATSYKNNYYGLPASAIAFVLVCNKKMFDEAGVKPPKTWSEFREAAKKLTKDTNGDGVVDQYGLVLLGGDRGGFTYRLIPFIYKAGGNILGSDNRTVEFNSEIGVSALKLFCDMFQVDHSVTPGFLAYTLSEIADLFSSDKVAMSIEGPWFREFVEDKMPGKDFYTVPVPVPDDRIELYETSPTLQDLVMYPIYSKSKHLNEAWEFLKFLRNEKTDMDWIKSDMGGVATTLYALNSSEAKKVKDLDIYKNELQYARPLPPNPSMDAVTRNIMPPYCQKAVIGELTPKEALDLAAKATQKLILEGENNK